MYENLIPLAWLGLSSLSVGKFSDNKLLHLNGGLARYNIYKTKDNKYLALGALEEKFWKKFCTIIEAPDEITLEKLPQQKVIKKIQKIIIEKNESFWKKKFDKENDVCCTTVKSIVEFMKDRHISNKNIFSNNIVIKNKKFFSIPTALDRKLIKVQRNSRAPKLGENNNLIKKS
jgi:crotonobetainyl-CoA:carnitine CoA-transferase CaiB-like acyl-CoA transferase